MFAGKLPLGILGHLSSKHRRTPEIVLSKGHASFRITSSSPVQRIAAESSYRACLFYQVVFQLAGAFEGEMFAGERPHTVQGYLGHKKHLPP